jgi:hypothetical protein
MGRRGATDAVTAGGLMTIIKRRPRRIPIVRHVSRLRQPNRDLLVAYAGFIGDSPDYVINQLIETVLAKDREFTAWRGDARRRLRRRLRWRPTRAHPRSIERRAGTPVMMGRLLAHRGLICLALSAVGGTVGVSEWPFPADDPVLAVIHDVQPTVYAVFLYGYLTLWFTSTWLLLYVGTSC